MQAGRQAGKTDIFFFRLDFCGCDNDECEILLVHVRNFQITGAFYTPVGVWLRDSRWLNGNDMIVQIRSIFFLKQFGDGTLLDE